MQRKKQGNKLPPFVPMTWELLNSKAYKHLSYAAAKALPYFLGKFKGPYHDPQRYLFEFPFSYSEAKRYKFSSSTFHKVIDALVRQGFIDPVDKGGLRSNGKSYNIFRLSRRWEKFGTDNFREANWQTFSPRQSSRATPKSETYSFKKGNEMAQDGEIISEFEAVEAF
jgi:hypothetical protein